MNRELLTADVPKIKSFLETILQDGGVKNYAINGAVTRVFNVDGLSGFDYKEEGLSGHLSVGLILGGNGYILKRVLRENEEISVRFDHYDLQGILTFTSDKEILKAAIVDFDEMDLTCPILNHFYNFLGMEYKKAEEGKSHTQLVHSVENFLRTMAKSSIVAIPVLNIKTDPAVINVYNKILSTEIDPVLTWEERQVVFQKYHETLKRILDTKIRAHKISKVSAKLALISKDFNNFLARFIARPMSNAKGLLYRYTIGKVIWFFQTVRNNLGYSVALAVYGPFTYYFITMPMNPHAMQAVGRVRTAYLDVKTEISRVLDMSEVAISDLQSKDAIAVVPTAPATLLETDSVSTTNAAPVVANDKNTLLANIITPSAITAASKEPLLISLGDGKTSKQVPSFLNMLLTTDSDAVNKVTWNERMSNFKQLQIAYEENIEYASRTGRLEQLETQYNFPMQIESTWEELERYNNMIFKLREENPNMSAKMKQFLFNEIDRTQQLELYLWDRMGRFILDQIYVMLDKDKEQKRNDYYVGRSFVFMEEMTNILSWRYKNFKKPEGYEQIEKLAEFYKKNRKENGTVMRNLQANSDLFKQKDVFDTKEFRGYMKRQWEILFLQNAKAEEASNMGLNMYIWSVRNTAWVLQTIYSVKREELALLMKRDTTGVLSPGDMLARSKMSMQYETLFHNLTLEYVGIREEIKNRLGKDIESTQRMVVIENLKESLTDREKLDNMGIAQNQKENGTKL